MLRVDIEASTLCLDPATSAASLLEQYDTTLSALLGKHAPVQTRTITVRPKVPWFSGEIKMAKQKRRQLERKWRQSRLTIYRDLFKEQRRHVNQLISSAKSTYYTAKITEAASDHKQLYNVVNALLIKPEASLPDGGSLEQLANRFSAFFQDKVLLIQENLTLKADPNYVPPDYSPGTVNNKLNIFLPTTEDEVRRLINKSPSKSCALDPVPTWFLKEHLDCLLPSITNIVNLSMSTGIVPTKMKAALVTPLLKTPSLDKDVMKNFRPVSNLSFISKLTERVVLNRLVDHVSRNNLQEKFQYAYKPNHSTETALMRIQNDILMTLDNKRGVLLFLLDLTAAFDTVDHTLLLACMRSAGVIGVAHKWFESYLTSRTQTVCLGQTQSDPSELLQGVPQGSVLGPVLFTLYTGPIGQIVRRHRLDFHLFADDSQLYVSFKIKDTNDEIAALARIQPCVGELKAWMTYHRLQLNDDKTEVLVITTPSSASKHSLTDVVIGDSILQPTAVARNIGVMFDSELSMKSQVSKLCKVAYFHLHRIRSIRDCLTQHATELLVHSLVISRLDYGNGLLDGVPDQLLDKLQRVQNVAARIVVRASRYDHITSILETLHWLPVRYRIEYKVLLMTFKALHLLAPSYIADLLQFYQPCRTLRSSSDSLLTVRSAHLRHYGDRAFCIAAPRLWNSLPHEMRKCDCLYIFKRLLKTILFKRSYYS